MSLKYSLMGRSDRCLQSLFICFMTFAKHIKSDIYRLPPVSKVEKGETNLPFYCSPWLPETAGFTDAPSSVNLHLLHSVRFSVQPLAQCPFASLPAWMPVPIQQRRKWLLLVISEYTLGTRALDLCQCFSQPPKNILLLGIPDHSEVFAEKSLNSLIIRYIIICSFHVVGDESMYSEQQIPWNPPRFPVSSWSCELLLLP